MTELDELRARIDQLTRECAESRDELHRANGRLTAVLGNSAVIFFELDLEGRFTRYEGLGLAAVGLQPGERLGQSVFDLYGELGDYVRRALSGEVTRWTGEVRGAYLEAVFVPTRSHEGTVDGASCVVTNVTARKRAEDSLRQSEQRFRTLVENSAEAIWLVGADGIIRYASPGTRKVAGYAPEAVVGQRAFDFVVEEDRESVARSVARTVADPSFVATTTFHLRHLDGSIRTVESTSTNLLADPAVGAVVHNARDVTEQKRMEAELRLREERYRSILESTSEGVVMRDNSGKLTFVNGRFAAMLGYTPDEMLARPMLELVHPDMHDRADARVERSKRGVAEVHQLKLRHQSGREVWVEITANPTFDGDGQVNGTMALISDHTDRRLADEARKWHAAIVESSDDAIIGINILGGITTWNRGAENLYGYRADEVLARSIELLLPPNLHAEESLILARLARGEAVEHYETTRRRKDGTLVDVSLTVSPVRDSTGAVVGASKIARDLTERRKSEARLLRAEEQLRQAQKLEAVGSLAGGIAHDFNNLLSVILSYTSLALDDLEPGSSLHADLEQIEQASERAAALTRQLLAFSRRQILEPQVLDLNRSLAELEQMLRRVLGEQIELSLMLDPKVGRVYVDRSQLEQVVMNLVVNAHDAMPDGGRLIIETAPAVLDEPAAAHHGVTPGKYAMLAVTDNGSGMDQATVARIFEPFFTTKPRGKGTGLGLSTVFGIVNQSGGHIWVYSEPGVGTTFKVYMPHSERVGSVVSKVAPASRALLPGHETVLLVEDEDAVRVTMRTILRRQGYHVIEAQNGAEALQLSGQYRTHIDLLLTDVVMPRMNGRQLAAQLTTLRPTLKVLYVSGYTENTIVHHGILDAGIAYLQKPITPQALERKVREVLDAP